MGMTVEEIRAAVEEKKQQALLDSFLQPSEVQYDFPEDKSFEGQLKHLAEQRDTAGIGQRAHREMGGGNITDILNARPDFMPLLEGMYGLAQGAMSKVTEGVRGVGEGISEIPHAQSPYSERGATHPEQMYEQLPGYAKLGSQMGYVAARYPHGIVSFLSESANMMLSPEEYKAEGRPEPTRGNLINESLYGFGLMLSDIPAQAYFQARAGLGATPPKWEMDMLGGTEAVNRLFEAPEAFGYGLLIGTGVGRAGKRSVRGKPKVGRDKPHQVAEEIAREVAKGEEKARTIQAYEKQEAQVNRMKLKIAQDWEGMKLYNNPGESNMGLPAEINRMTIDLRRNILEKYLDADLTGEKIWESGKDIVDFEWNLKQKELYDQANTWHKSLVAEARKNWKNKDILMSSHWMTPRRVVPEIYYPIENAMNLKFYEESEIANMRTELLKPLKDKKRSGQEIADFLDSHTTEEVGQYMTGERVGLVYKGAVYERVKQPWEITKKTDRDYTITKDQSFINAQVVGNSLLITASHVPPILRRKGIYTDLLKGLLRKAKQEHPELEYFEGNIISVASKKAAERWKSTEELKPQEESPLLRTRIDEVLAEPTPMKPSPTSGKWRQIRKTDAGRILKDKKGELVVEWIDNPEMIAELDGKVGRGSNRWLSSDELKLAGFDRALTDMLHVRGSISGKGLRSAGFEKAIVEAKKTRARLSGKELEEFDKSIASLVSIEKNIPAGSYISRYTTWLRDEIAKKPEESADPFSMYAGQQDAIPFLGTKIYNRFMESRTQKTAPPHLNVNESIPLYTHVMLKKIYLEPILKEIKPIYDKLPPNKQAYSQSWLNIIRGRKDIGMIGGAVESLRRGVPWLGKKTKPYMYDRATRRVMNLYYHSMLGLAFDSAIKNLTQTSLTIAKTDMASFVGGIKDFITKGLDEPRRQRVFEGFPDIFEHSDMPAMKSAIRKLADINMTPFQMAEIWNRGVTYYAAKRYFMSKGQPQLIAHSNAESFTKRRAAEFAKIIDKETQFEYGRMGTSPTLQGSTIRLFGQFTSFPLKHFETMLNWAKHDKRAFTRYLTLCGIMTMTADQLGYDWSEVFGKNLYPTFEQGAKGWSPAGQALMGTGGAIWDIHKGRPYKAKESLTEKATALIPAQRFVSKVWKYYKQAKKGVARTSWSGKIEDVTWGQAIGDLLGFKRKERKELFEEINAQHKDDNYFDDAVKHHIKRVRTFFTDKKFDKMVNEITEIEDPMIRVQVLQSMKGLGLLDVPLQYRGLMFGFDKEKKAYKLMKHIERKR